MNLTPFFSFFYLSSMRKPAWLDDGGHVFNGQSNVYVVPAAMVKEALAASGP